MKTGQEVLMIVVAALCFSGCVEELPADDAAEGTVQEVNVKFDVVAAFPVRARSSIAADEAGIKDVNMYIYAGGRLEQYEYQSAELPLEARLKDAVPYNVYILANVGKVEPPENEADLASLRHAVETAEDLGGFLPMAWSRHKIRFTDKESNVDVKMERLVSKIRFSIDSEALPELRVESVRLRQCALEVFPFAGAGSGLHGSVTDVVGDCDFASEEDLEVINSGGEIFFYALENCQGTLLPDNDDPLAKNPDSLGEKAGCCTYLEVGCRFEEGGIYEGNVIYRFYAGLDNRTNFDVRRNTDVGIRLIVTGEGMRKVSWLVDADVSVMPGFASGWVEEGLHNMDGLYVGEVFLCGFEVAEDLLGDYGGSVESLGLKFVSDNGNEGIVFGEVREDGPCTGIVEARCICPAEGELWLCDSAGERIVRLDGNVNVLKPGLLFSSEPEAGADGKVLPLSAVPCCEVNGSEDVFYMYIADDNGLNLNAGYGFDLSLFGLGGYCFKSEYPEFDLSTVVCRTSPGSDASGGYALKMVYAAVNDGADAEHNKALSETIFASGGLHCEFEERNYGLDADTDMKLDYCPVSIGLAGNDWKEYFSDVHCSLIVDNPSNIPLDIDAAQVVGWKGTSTSLPSGGTARMKKLETTEMCFITDTYMEPSAVSDTGPELYGNVISIHSERNGTADRYVTDGDRLVHAMNDFDIEDLALVAVYQDGRVAKGLCHLFDVSSNGHNVEKLTAGSNSPEYEHAFSGYGDNGCWLYTNNDRVFRPGAYLDRYGCFTVRNLKETVARNKVAPVILEVFFNNLQIQWEAKNADNGIIYADVFVEGRVDGAVTTYPKGKWGKAQHNVCHTTFSSEHKKVMITPRMFCSVDDYAVYRAMKRVYGITFKDSHNNIGANNSWEHHAHPTAVTFNLRIKLHSDNVGMLPVKVIFKDNTLHYHHDQELKNYYPVFNPTYELFEFTLVEEK